MVTLNSGNKTIVILPAYFSFLVLINCSQKKESEKIEKKPNVLILFSDQHNKKVLGFEGHPDMITPNLDKLAEE